MTEKEEKMDQLAREVLKLSRNTLMVNLRFLDAALSQFELFPIEESSLLTDGRHLLYNARSVLESYKTGKEIPVRDYLHIVMHCVFRHMYMDPTLNRPYWDLACDIAVENAITELGLRSVTTDRERPQAKYIAAIRRELKQVTAEKIYAWLRTSVPDPKVVAEIRGHFYADNHEIWYMTADAIEQRFGLSPDKKNNKQSDDEQESGEQGVPGGIPMEGVWKSIAERMQVDLETFGKQRGIQAGALTQNLAAVNREKYDYSEFLKKFAVTGEVMKVNNDEFDTIFYTYGLHLYERMPLIEPLEYKEVKAIREFVIAIDTSGSTSGELVQKFVQKTYNILKSTESFFSKINLHIIQCDADIQEDKKITCQADFDEYLKTMTLRGMGGTDFRPVFEYVDQLQRNKEFTDLRGMIYFTDGCGTFPARMPNYKTAFVFIDDDYNDYNVPPWAMKLILQRDEI